MTIFEAWEDEDGVTLSTINNIAALKNKGLISKNAKRLYQIKANHHEEAMVEHHHRMGWEAYRPESDHDK